MIISQYFMIITILHNHITILHRHMTSRHEIGTQSKAKDTKRPFNPLPGHHKPPTSKHWAPSSKSARKISKKICDSRKKRALVKDNGNPSVKSCVCSPATLSTEGFFKKPSSKSRVFASLSNIRKTGNSELRNSLLRSPFGRPTPVWGRALESSSSLVGKHRIGKRLILRSRFILRIPPLQLSFITSE